MSSCISQQWGVDPLFIREGGSIPSLPFLEREFSADAVHFPMGTSSDSAHLPDERIRVLNLEVRGPLYRLSSSSRSAGWRLLPLSVPSSTALTSLLPQNGKAIVSKWFTQLGSLSV